MKKRKRFMTVGLIGLFAIGLIIASGFLMTSCGDNCGGGCKVTWTSDGEHLGGGACGAYSCSSECIVYRNWFSNKTWPGTNIIYRCDCQE